MSSEIFFSNPVTVVSYTPGRLDVFALGKDKRLWHQWFDGTNWGHWECLSGKNEHRLFSAVSWGPNRLDVFAVDTNREKELWHYWWNGGSGWGTEVIATKELLGKFDSVSAISWGTSRLDLFVLDTDEKTIWHNWSDGSSFNQWECLKSDKFFQSFSVKSWGPSRLDVFAVDTDEKIWHQWSDGTNWGQWENLGK
ncbi:hypothetical protein [Sulfurovum sp.]|uniref:hypothetical protein n=1 Tax=Sulfurovum sp. TaxID=1969726 RepID=UPI0035646A78